MVPALHSGTAHEGPHAVRILFLTHRLPYTPNRGDRIRAYHLLHAMSRFAKVSLFSLVHDDEEAAAVDRVPFADSVTPAHVHRVRNLVAGGLRLASRRPLTHSLLDAPGAGTALRALVRSSPPDLVVAYCSGMARYALETPLARFPFVLDMVDVDSAKWVELSSRSRGLRRWIYAREAKTLGAFEARAARMARRTLVVNEREFSVMRGLAPDAAIEIVRNGIDLDAFRPPGPPVRDPTVVFCGVMDYAPNTQGVEWFVREVWPIVRNARPDARFLIVGASPSATMREWPKADATIEVTGAVPAVQPYLWRAAVSVAPLHLARGLQNKVLEALAAGLPVVATPQVIDGLPAEARSGCRRGDTAAEFADSLIRLLELPAASRRALALSAVPRGLEWSQQLAAVESICRDAIARR